MLQAHMTDDGRVIFTESLKKDTCFLTVEDGDNSVTITLSKTDFKELMSLSYTLKFKEINIETTIDDSEPF